METTRPNTTTKMIAAMGLVSAKARITQMMTIATHSHTVSVKESLVLHPKDIQRPRASP